MIRYKCDCTCSSPPIAVQEVRGHKIEKTRGGGKYTVSWWEKYWIASLVTSEDLSSSVSESTKQMFPVV